MPDIPSDQEQGDTRVDEGQPATPANSPTGSTASTTETAPTCPYCGRPSEFVTGAAVYPHRCDLWGRDFYQCDPCGAHVGCHRGTRIPLGRLANAELRAAKIAAHDAFDAKWRRLNWRRGDGYRWLAAALGIPKSLCHIGMFDVDQCRRVVDICREQQPCMTL